MAEVFGVISGALSVASLFNNCVECFEYIQLGRHFARDYQVCQLQLDVAKVRLVRWSEAVNLDTDLRFNIPPSPAGGPAPADDDRTMQLARAILTEMVSLLQAANNKAKRYEMTAQPRDLERCEEKDMTPVYRQLHQRLRRIGRGRRGQQADGSSRGSSQGSGKQGSVAGLAHKTAWALYDRNQFKRLIEDVVELVDGLEKLFPLVEETYRRLAEADIDEVSDEPSLRALQDAAQDTDHVLLDAVVRKGEALVGHNFARTIEADTNTDVQVGDRYTQAVLATGFAAVQAARNTADKINAKGSAKVQVGNRYG